MGQETRLPTFLIIGAMKGGTTSLYEYLRAHPQVFMPQLKEVDFFTEELNWKRGRAWYERQFAAASSEHLALGEASTSYTKFPRYQGAPQKIAEWLPDVRLVYVVRDPVQRIRSHYQHNVTLGEEKDPIHLAVRNNPAYLDYSRYALQIERYLEFYEASRLLVILSEDLRSDRQRTVEDVLRHVGADPSIPIPTLQQEFYKSEERSPYGPGVTFVRDTLRKMFPSRAALWRGTFIPTGLKRRLARAQPLPAQSTAMPEDTVQWIRSELHEDVARLRTHTGSDLSRWRFES